MDRIKEVHTVTTLLFPFKTKNDVVHKPRVEADRSEIRYLKTKKRLRKTKKTRK